MNRELVSKALNQIDEELIAESLTYRGGKSGYAPERNAKMEKHGEYEIRKRYKRLSPLALAACMILALAITAYAANFWGIREMWRTPGRELPDAATEWIQDRNESAVADGWSARITESLCDATTMMVTVNVSCGERYILAPTDAMPEDSVSVIGLAGEETLAEYAEAQGKKLLLVGANVQGLEELGIYTAAQRFEHIADDEMVILIQAEKSVSAASIDAICTVYALESDSEHVQRVEIPFALTDAPSEETGFSPVDPDAVPGLRIGVATVTETPLGVSVQFPIYADDDDAIYKILKMECDELTDYEGGCVLDEGVWYVRWTMGQGTVTNTLTVHCYDGNNQLMGNIVFQK